MAKMNFHKNTTGCFSAALGTEVSIGVSEAASDTDQKSNGEKTLKHTKKYTALCLAMALGCLAVLTACSGDKSTSQTQSTTASASQAASGSTEETAQETVMGEVTYVGSSYISVTAYTGGEDVTDFTTLDVSGLTASEETESIDTAEDTEYLKVEEGMLNSATRDDVTTGTFIVSTYDEDGTHQIILIESGEAADAGEETASGSSEAASASTVEEGTDEEESAAADDAQLSEESSAAQA